MHFHPILLVKADNLEEAKIKAEDFCDCECGDHSYFDYGGIVPDEETEWNRPLAEVWDKLPPANHVGEAKQFIAKAETDFNTGNYGLAGYNYRKAGLLLEEAFCTETTVFNVEYNDYSRINENGWYAIEADLHF